MGNRPGWTMIGILAISCGACTATRVGSPLTPRDKHSTSPAQESGGAQEQGISFALRSSGLPVSGMWKCDPVFGDVNGDGKIDLAALPRLGYGPRVWLGNGKGGWTESSGGLKYEGRTRSCGGGLSLGDVNGDGLMDLAVADHCQGVFVYLGDGTGKWEVVAKAVFPRQLVPRDSDRDLYIGAEDLTLADVNGDGYPDLIVGACDEGGVGLYLGDGTGANWEWVSTGLSSMGWANRVTTADINGDGLIDVVASQSEGVRAWIGDGQGGFTAVSTGLPTPMIQGLYTGVAVGDVNEDGRLDIATANWVDGPEVYLQEPDGSWKKTPDVSPDMRGGASGLALGDIDGDGHLDIVFSGRLNQNVGYVYGVYVLLGDGRGGWVRAMGSGLPETGLAFTFGVTVADFDEDGVLDIAAGSGGIVATDRTRKEPVIPSRLLVWSTRLAGDDVTAASKLSGSP